MRMSVRSGWVMVVVSAALLALGCGTSSGESTESVAADEVGVAQLAITSVPSGVRCIRTTVQGRRETVVQEQEVSEGQSTAAMVLQNLPTGLVSFEVGAFLESCASVPAGADAPWSGQVPEVFLRPGKLVHVAVTLRGRIQAEVSVDFLDDSCSTQGEACGAPFECCAGLSCVAGQCSSELVCVGTPGEWEGCRGTGCSVCSELVADYPFYFVNHPECVLNEACAGETFLCNERCPAPMDSDRDPGPACAGAPGQWDGCRGTGCSVCSELVADYPFYFRNHPSCVPNEACGGEYFTCSDLCPAPAAEDQAPAACAGTPGVWNGCRGTGCSVCSELVADYPFYFVNHPSCVPNDACGGEAFLCNYKCPEPTVRDRDPDAR